MVSEDDFGFAQDWFHDEWELYDDLLGGEPEIMADNHLADLFDTALFDMNASPDDRADAYDELIDYLWDEYGIDFEEDFDWEGYREWYDAA